MRNEKADRQLLTRRNRPSTTRGLHRLLSGWHDASCGDPESEPDILQALRFGAVLENVALDEDYDVNYTDTSITQNTRGAYPIKFIQTPRSPAGRATRPT